MNKPIIDLHVHSNYSDGKRSLEYIKNKSLENNVGVIALAEHYNMSSFIEFRKLVQNQIEVIPAIEISASLLSYGLSKRHVCHIVAYFPTTKIYSILDHYELSREKCVKRTLELLKKEGINISYKSVVKFAKDKTSVGRFDIATTLSNLGFAPTPAAAYSKFFDLNSPVYIDREKMQVGELIKNILNCKGLPVLVHPKSVRLNDSDFTCFISELKAYGLVGIEAYNPHNSPEKIEFFKGICEEFELIPTVGTDYHGRSNEEVEIGLGIENNLMIDDYKIIKALKKKEKELHY